MRDLLTNIKKAIEVLNKSKGLNISLTDDLAEITLPDLDRADLENLYLMDKDDLFFFSCDFNYDDLIAEESEDIIYLTSMKKIMARIYDAWKIAKKENDESTISLNGPQTISGAKVLSVNGGNLSWGGSTLSASQSAFSDLHVGGDLEVNGEIESDDIKVNGGQLSVSSELDRLTKETDVLKARLQQLEALFNKVMGGEDDR